MSVFKEFGSAARRNAAPVTTAIVILIIAGFLLSWLVPTSNLLTQLPFTTANASAKPWTFLTYPFYFMPIPGSVVSAIFASLWIWGIGGTIERDMGQTKYVLVWLLFSALCAFTTYLGGMILHVPVYVGGPWIPIVAITVLWGTRYPDLNLLFMFVIPMQAKWVAWLSVVLVFFDIQPNVVAPFGALPYLLAYFYAVNKLPFAPYAQGERRYQNQVKKTERYDKTYYEEVRRREKDREERERLRRLFEGSIRDDDEKEK